MNTFTRFCATSALTILLSTSALAAGQDNALTLVDAVSKGVLKNPEYGVVANNKEATVAELDQARALWMPSLDMTADTGLERTRTPGLASTESLYRNRASVSLTQLLFDGFGTPAEIERQKFRVKSAAHRVGEAAEFIGLDIVQAYLDTLRQRDLVAIAHTNVDDHLHILETLRTGARAGTATKGDVSQAEARVAQAKTIVSQTEQDLRAAESLFLQKVGEFPGDMSFPSIPRDKLPADVEEAVRAALVHSPTLAVFRTDQDVALAEYKGSGSTLYPRITIEGNASTGNNVAGLEGNTNNESILAVMRWNLYRGGADRDRQREFIYRHAQAKERSSQAARQVERDMRSTWSAMNGAAERAQRFLEQANANSKVVSVYLDQFSLDRRTLLDVLDAQNELFVSRSSYISALYAEMFGVFRVLALEGKLLPTLNVPYPREAQLKK